MLCHLKHPDISTQHISIAWNQRPISFAYSITDTEKVVIKQSPMLKENSDLLKWHLLDGFVFTHLPEMETITPYVYLRQQSKGDS